MVPDAVPDYFGAMSGIDHIEPITSSAQKKPADATQTANSCPAYEIRDSRNRDSDRPATHQHGGHRQEAVLHGEILLRLRDYVVESNIPGGGALTSASSARCSASPARRSAKRSRCSLPRS
jgi:hypothetical protein